VRYSLPEPLLIEGFALLPTLSTRVSSAQGEADVSIGMLGAAVHLRLTDRSFRTRLGVGGAALLLHMDGSAVPPYQSRSDSVISGAPFLSFGIARELGSTLSLGAEMLAGVALPRPVIEFAGGAVASWGRPFACAALTLDVSLP
jgi:hypothetical protein